jgi:uncharacterized Fe-S cluster protein YjdI
MAARPRIYRSETIAVAYDAARCIHVGECVRGLPGVFARDRRPWIDATQADADAIAEVVRRCPSGALTYERLDGGAPEALPEETTVQRVPDGPLYLHGHLRIEDAEGGVFAEGTRMALCRCGQSANKPFCDNSHNAAGFQAD